LTVRLEKKSKMAEQSYHVRLVVMGGSGVGKSAIIKRFLFNNFIEKHRPTVEDLFFKEFNLGNMLLKVRLLIYDYI
jgi:GTPase SAR1 family protein